MKKNLTKYFIAVFLILIVSCNPRVANNPDSNTEHETLAPIWNQEEYIFYNKTAQQITAIHRESEREVSLNEGECVFIGAYQSLALKTQDGFICDFFREDGQQQTSKLCSDQIVKILRSNYSLPEKGEFSYIYFYNITSAKDIFEKASEPRQKDKSFTHSCKVLSEDNL